MRIVLNGWLESILQELRIWKISPFLPKGGVLVDVGCDDPQVLINKVRSQMKLCVGIDIVVTPKKFENVELLQQDLQKKIQYPSDSADAVTMLAVLEHMKHPQDMLREAFRILKKGGVLLVTVPSPASQKVLEIAAPLKIVRQEMIDQHENYFTLEDLRSIAKSAGFQTIHVEHWEFGVNTFLRAVK